MDSYYAGLLIDVAPGLTIVSVALLAALPPYLIMYQSRHGRARAQSPTSSASSRASRRPG